MITIIYEDDDIIVVKKPAGMESQSGKNFSMDLSSAIKNEFAKRIRTRDVSEKKEKTKEEIYLGVVHRLDKPVSGVMVYAKNKKAAANLSKQIQEHKVKKYYYALLCKKPAMEEGTLTDYLIHDEVNNRTTVEKKHDFSKKASKKAVLHYRICPMEQFHGFDTVIEMTGADKGKLTLVKIELVTGRPHQIRVQFSNQGCPIFGDQKYNQTMPAMRGSFPIALCAFRLEFDHPSTGKKMDFQM